ncbi:MAG TPA: Nif3-like dinuclear metal center hexameric protein [Deltaproteobacteria bacterium]|nr:Nif3-like dinuclear metal center hexameric protein [Deltaproteobacteria bacterium]HBG72170.1 Nif3-like dinuclear metal center hexameric protein [Deltaproteobacteria bacterium]
MFFWRGGPGVRRGAVVTVKDVWRALDERFPFAHCADWDNVGILLGDPAAPVRSVLVALDATPAVLARLRRRPAELLVTHHPVVFTPLKSVRPDPGPSAAAFSLLRMGVAAISAHTNADAAPRGVSHAMARRLRLRGVRPLIPGEPSSGACKVVVFVPPSHAESVLDAAAEAGGARIGEYSRCSFRSPGTGTFLGGPGSSPRAGKPGKEERVQEFRLETVAPGSRVQAVLRAVRKVHPYEEPAIDVVPLREGALGGGIGIVGLLPEPLPLDRALDAVRRAFRPSWIHVAGPRRKTVRRVAIVGGSGAEFASAAREAGADLYITGDVKYHQALEAAAGDMPVADIGHASGERWILPEFRRVITARFPGAVTAHVIMEEEPLRATPAGRRRGGEKP